MFSGYVDTLSVLGFMCSFISPPLSPPLQQQVSPMFHELLCVCNEHTRSTPGKCFQLGKENIKTGDLAARAHGVWRPEVGGKLSVSRC